MILVKLEIEKQCSATVLLSTKLFIQSFSMYCLHHLNPNNFPLNLWRKMSFDLMVFVNIYLNGRIFAKDIFAEFILFIFKVLLHRHEIEFREFFLTRTNRNNRFRKKILCLKLQKKITHLMHNC